MSSAPTRHPRNPTPAHMGRHAEAVARRVDVSVTRADGGTKAAAAASANYDFGGGLGCFARASFSDGQNESWAFTEIDRSLAVGAVQSGARWGRGNDEAGLPLGLLGRFLAQLSHLDFRGVWVPHRHGDGK